MNKIKPTFVPRKGLSSKPCTTTILNGTKTFMPNIKYLSKYKF